MKILMNCKIGKDTKVNNYTNLYHCKIGDNCMIGAFVEIQKGVEIGNNVRIQSHSFVCSNVKIEDNVFIGHGVMFTNAKYHSMKTYPNHKILNTIVKEGASIGSNATILPVYIGIDSIIGAGSVVTKDVLDETKVVGNPAKTYQSWGH